MQLFSDPSNFERTADMIAVWLLVGSSVVLFLLATISLKIKKLSDLQKEILFFSIVFFTLAPTLFMAVTTVYVNVISQSGGPVHWHADIEIWNCGKEVDLKDPTGLSNKIGTPTLHEHNDKRIHVEGVVVKPEDVNLGKFFKVIDGKLTPTSFTVPTNQGMVTVSNGNFCPDGQGEVQLFVYRTGKDGYYTQDKIANPDEYVLSPQQNVPAGDCMIVEFGPNKSRTDKMCRSYQVAEKIGKLKGERSLNGY